MMRKRLRRKNGRKMVKPKENTLQNLSKRAIRSKQITTKTAELFAKKGYHSVTMEEVAQKVGIAKGTVYLYFESKENLYLEILEQAFEELEGLMQLEIDKTAPANEKLSEVLKVVFAYFRDNLDILKILTRDETHLIREHSEFTEQWKNRGLALYKKILDRGVKEGLFVSTNTTLTALIIYGLVRSVTFHYKTNKSPEKVAEEVYSVIASGILVPGEKSTNKNH